MQFIDSKDGFFHKGMNLGIAMIIISLLAPIKNPWVQFPFDWILVFFSGLSIFFFFMAIRLNTDVTTNVNINNDHQTNMSHKTKFVNYETHLNNFNKLSKASFIISLLLAIVVIIRLIIILV